MCLTCFKYREYHGAGTGLVLGLVHIAQEARAKIFKLCSTSGATLFYRDHLGMAQLDDDIMIFDKNGMANFSARQENIFRTLSGKL